MKPTLIGFTKWVFLSATFSFTASAADIGVLMPVYSLLFDEGVVADKWGADLISESHRPDISWIGNFNGVTPLLVAEGSSIEATLASCASEYCVLSIGQLQLSDTVYLDRPKTKLQGLAGNRITYLDSVDEVGAFVEIGDNMQEIVIQGLNLDGHFLDGQVHEYGNTPVFGILIEGQDIDKISVTGNQVHHINSDDNAHAIAAYGTGASEAAAITNLSIKGNQVFDMRTGSSESLVVNGNVNNWEIVQNAVSRVNNIAIDAIGGEGTAPTQISNGRTLPGPLDVARFGFIQNNTVVDMTTLDNPAYNSQHSWAGAIYVDGARNLLISGNTVSNAEWAYDIGAENCLRSRHIVLENNTAAGSYYGDLLLGGYAPTGYPEDISIGCDPLSSVDDDEGHGYVENVTVKNNQFNTDTPVDDQGRINLQFRIRQSIITQSGVSEDHPNGLVSGDENSIRVAE